MKKFEKIVTWIQEEVRSGRMVSGEKLPSEQELSEQFQVSRQTVRRALEELVKENIVESRRGSGSYICEDAGRKTNRSNADVYRYLYFSCYYPGN